MFCIALRLIWYESAITILLAVSEAGSGTFLLETLGNVSGYVPVVSRMESKFCKPAKGRTLINVYGEVVDENGVVALSSEVEWFIAREKEQRA